MHPCLFFPCPIVLTMSMDLLVSEPDGGSNLSRLPGFLGQQNKYVRMDDAAVLPREQEAGAGRYTSSAGYMRPEKGNKGEVTGDG